MPRKTRTAEPSTELHERVSRGPVTLVLGAGVSMSRLVPGWNDLAADLWLEAFGERPAWLSPTKDDQALLELARKRLKGKVPSELLSRLTLEGPPPHPLLLPMLFEEVEAKMNRRRRDRLRRTATEEGSDELDDTFAGAIRDAMYRYERRVRGDTLAVIADVVAREQRSARRRLLRVVTFNADDLLEREVHRGLDGEHDAPIAWIVARASHNPSSSPGLHGCPPIPIYHVHGFLPRDPEERWWTDAPDTLVFTEAQYWQSVASPLSFANRVMAAALHDSHCLFIGLSMTDVNIMRWLGVRYGEIVADREAQRRQAGDKAEAPVELLKKRALAQHLWIRTRSADRTGLVTSQLQRRGVESVVLPEWGAPFRRWMNGIFPHDGG